MPDTPLSLIDDSATPPAPAAAPAEVPLQAAADARTDGPAELPPLAEPVIPPVVADVVTLPAPLATPAATPAEVAPPAAPAPPELSPAECAARLAELFPALFAAIPNTPPRPIKLRIQSDIQQRAPGLFTRRSLSPFLHRHTTSTAYLKALIASPHRFDLDGAPAGEVSDEHRQAAVAELERRRMLHEARRAELRQAQRARSRPAAATAQETGAAPDAPPDHVASAIGPKRDAPPRGRGHREDPRRRPDRADRPPRPAQPARSPGRPPHERPTRETPVAETPPRDASAAPQVAPPAADDSARRERALLLRAFETSTLSRANFCVLKRIDPATLDALLEQARSEAAPALPGAPRDGARPPTARHRPR